MISRNVSIVYGSTGSGKTSLANRLSRDARKLVVLDAGFSEFPGRHFYDFGELADFIRDNHAGNYRVSYSPLSGEYSPVFSLTKASGVYAMSSPVTLVLEEADRFYVSPEFEDLIVRGRHYNVNIIAIVIRPYLTLPSLRSVATDLYIAKIYEPRDIAYFSEFLDETEIAKLKKYQFLHLNLESRKTEIIKSR